MEGKRNRINKWLVTYIVLSLVWMGVIFYFSAQTGEKSDSQSGFVVDVLTAIVPFDITDDGLGIITFIIRKAAHFTEYGVLGFFFCKAILHGRGKKSPEEYTGRFMLCIILITTFMCMLYAASDEFHQSFTDGRAPAVRDVAIDTMGGLFGSFIAYITYKLQKAKKYAKGI